MERLGQRVLERRKGEVGRCEETQVSARRGSVWSDLRI